MKQFLMIAVLVALTASPSLAKQPAKATLGTCAAAVSIAEMHNYEWQSPLSKDECAEIAGKAIDDGMAMIKKSQEMEND